MLVLIIRHVESILWSFQTSCNRSDTQIRTGSFSRPNFSCDEHTIIQIVYSMGVATLLLRQKMPSKLSRVAKSKQQRQKEMDVATIGGNHPAVAALRKNKPSDPEITSQVICCTSPRRKSPEIGFMSQQAAALLTQKADNDDASILGCPQRILTVLLKMLAMDFALEKIVEMTEEGNQ
jgi:hypothetical protein